MMLSNRIDKWKCVGIKIEKGRTAVVDHAIEAAFHSIIMLFLKPLPQQNIESDFQRSIFACAVSNKTVTRRPRDG